MIPTQQPKASSDAVILTYDRAFKQALREPANHLQQLENLARGALRFSTTWLVYTLANACLLVLLIMAVSPAETVGLWEAARTAALDASKVPVTALDTQNAHDRLTPATGDAQLSHYSKQAQDALKAAVREPSEKAIAEYTAKATIARDVAIARAAGQREITPPPSYAESQARDLLSEIIKVAMLGCALVGLFANIGGFTNVYAKVARERVQCAEALMREQALQEQLANRVTVAVLAALRKDGEA